MVFALTVRAVAKLNGPARTAPCVLAQVIVMIMGSVPMGFVSARLVTPASSVRRVFAPTIAPAMGFVLRT